jgi:hypothetical protein
VEPCSAGHSQVPTRPTPGRVWPVATTSSMALRLGAYSSSSAEVATPSAPFHGFQAQWKAMASRRNCSKVANFQDILSGSCCWIVSRNPQFCFRMIRSGQADRRNRPFRGRAASRGHPAWVSLDRWRSHRTWPDANQIGFRFRRCRCCGTWMHVLPIDRPVVVRFVVDEVQMLYFG